MAREPLNFHNLLDRDRGFSHLCNRLIARKDPNAKLYLKAGRDFGIDAKSGDSLTAFQFKFYFDFKKLLQDLSKEAKKIAKYKQDGGMGQALWRGVIHYVVMTSADALPQWEASAVREEFGAVGLTLEVVQAEILRHRIAEFPDLENWFFGGVPRLFYELDEQEDYYSAELTDLGRATLALPLLGRKEANDKFEGFLNNPVQKLLVCEGAGGVGKSRLLLALAQVAKEHGHQVFFCDADSLAGGATFAHVRRAERTILFLDEPRIPESLRALLAQVKRDVVLRENWKIVAGIRSYQDTIKNVLTENFPDAGKQRDTIHVEPLNKEDAKELTETLLQKLNLNAEYFSPLWNASDGIPIWLVLGVEVLKAGIAPAQMTKAEIVNFRLKQICREIVGLKISAKIVESNTESLIRHVALLEPINTEDNSDLELLAKTTELKLSEVKVSIDALVERRFLIKRGRLVKIHPDVMRDYIVAEWLAPGGKSSEAHAELLPTLSILATPSRYVSRMVNGIGRTEYISNADLLGKICTRLVAETPQYSNSQRISLISNLEPLTVWRPKDYTNFSKAILRTPKDVQIISEDIGGRKFDREFAHDEVVRNMAWPLLNAGTYAQSESDLKDIFYVLTWLLDLESKEENANDGKHANDILPRLVKWGSRSLTNSQHAALEYCDQLASLLKEKDWSAPFSIVTAAKALAMILRELVGCRFVANEFEDNGLVIKQWFMPIVGPATDLRKQAVSKAIELTSAQQPGELRMIGWKTIHEAARALNEARGYSKIKDAAEHWSAELLDLFSRVQASLVDENDVSILSMARKSWNWTLQYSKIKPLEQKAMELEKIVEQKPSIAYAHLLFSSGDTAKSDAAFELVVSKLSEVLRADNYDHIVSAFRQIQDYQGEKLILGALSEIGRRLGAEFPEKALKLTDKLIAVEDEKFLNYAGSVLRGVRQADIGVGGGFQEYQKQATAVINRIGDPKRKSTFLLALYPMPYHPKINGRFGELDFKFCRAQIDALFSNVPEFAFQFAAIAALAFQYDKAAAETWIAELGAKVDSKYALNFFSGMVNGIYYVELFEKLPLGKVDLAFILRQLVAVPNVGRIGGNIEWQLDAMIERVGGLSLAWFIQFVDARELYWQPKLAAKGEKRGWSYDDPSILDSVTKVWRFVKEGELEEPDKEVSAATFDLVRQVVNWRSKGNILGYLAPTIAADLDPHGKVVPNLIVENLERVRPQDDVAEFSRWCSFAGHYSEGSAPWRKIAASALAKARLLEDRERPHVYVAIQEQESRAYTSEVGQIPPHLIEQKKFYLEKAQSEGSQDFRRYFEWRAQSLDLDIEHHRLMNEERTFQ